MLNKLIRSIKYGNILNSVKIRLRLVFRIKNKNVYEEYTRCKEYQRLQKKYKKIIDKGVSTNLPRSKSNFIWICWLQGMESAPRIVKACVNSIIKAMPDKQIIILTNDNIFDYINLPDYILRKKENGIIPLAHFTDLIRIELLCNYGGGWIDATVLCTTNKIPSFIDNASLFVYKQFDLYQKDIYPIMLSSWLIFSEKNHPILLLTRDLLFDYWKENNKLTHYFTFHFFFSMAARRYFDLWEDIPPVNNHGPHTLQLELKHKYSCERWEQITSISCFHKLNRRLDYSSIPDSMYCYILKTFNTNFD